MGRTWAEGTYDVNEQGHKLVFCQLTKQEWGFSARFKCNNDGCSYVHSTPIRPSGICIRPRAAEERNFQNAKQEATR